jgi:hypothetical protein
MKLAKDFTDDSESVLRSLFIDGHCVGCVGCAGLGIVIEAIRLKIC